jgi:hypothetical protein
VSELSIGDIRCFRPALTRQAGDRIDLERQRIGQAITQLLASRPHASAWSGPAALAGFTRNAEATRMLGDLANRLGVTAQVLAHLADRMQTCLDLVRHADLRAADGGGWLNHEGQLFLPQAPTYLDPVLVAHHAKREALLREEIDRDLRQAQSLARQADHDAAARLTGAAGGAATMSLPGADRLPLPIPPPRRQAGQVDPAAAFANAAWWRALTPEERARTIREHPDWVGPRDGLPGWARHQANLALLARLEIGAATELAAVEDHRYGSQVAKREDRRWKTQRVESLRMVREVMSQRDGVPRQLLQVDDTGPIVQAAIAIGDVDTAEHVVTQVGGFTTTVGDSLRRLDRESKEMRDEADSLTEGEVAVVNWLGYPAPQWAGLATPGASVLGEAISSGYADELASFLNGLDAARDSPVHSTLWAHSYGSNIAGHALLRTVAVDDVVLFGSPGVPFRKVEDVGLKPNALNVLAAPDDWIPKAGPLLLGTPPLAVPGARRLATLHVKGMPNDLRTAGGHSEYRAPGTLSRRNLVAVAAGRPDLLIRASPEESRPTGGVQGPGPTGTGPVPFAPSAS